jgi:hypothetical protein
MLHPDLTPEAREYLRDLVFSELVANMPAGKQHETSRAAHLAKMANMLIA